MALKKSERQLTEAIDTMLRHEAELGLQKLPDDKQQEEEHSFQYLHEQINEMFAIKAAGLTHHDGVCAAFKKIHNYKYITDPMFGRAVEKEMTAQGIPHEERSKALNFIPAVIKEVRGSSKDWDEKDAGFNPNLAEVMKVSRPGTKDQ